MLREFSTPVKLKVSIRNFFICQMESSRGCNREMFGPLKKGISSSGRTETLLSQAVMSKQELTCRLPHFSNHTTRNEEKVSKIY